MMTMITIATITSPMTIATAHEMTTVACTMAVATVVMRQDNSHSNNDGNEAGHWI